MQIDMEGTVNVKSRTEYYNTDHILSKWGFTDNQCHHCGILNSDLNGLLMQCAKCKKAYYCSMKCFNEALPVHQKFCTTKKISSEPKGQDRAPFKFEDDPDPVKKAPLKEEKPVTKYDTAPVESKGESVVTTAPVLKKPLIVQEHVSSSKAEQKPLKETSTVDDKSTKFAPERGISDDNSIEDEEEEQDSNEVADLQNSVYSLDLDAVTEETTTIHVSMSQSYSEFGFFIPERKSHSREEVDLRHAEQMKREYGWTTPDWVDARLRATPRGRLLKEMGDLVSPITNANVLIEKGIITWEAPIWTNAKLRKTPRGEEIKRAATMTAEQKLALSRPLVDVAPPRRRKSTR